MSFDIRRDNNETIRKFLYPQGNKIRYWSPTRSEFESIVNFFSNPANLENLFVNYASIFFGADPQNGILSCRLYPCRFTANTTTFKIYGQTPAPTIYCEEIVNNRLAWLYDLGHIFVPYYQDIDSYLSYEPYTKVFVYLPFFGMLPLDARRYVGHTMQVNAAIDFYKGDVVYFVSITDDEEEYTLVDSVRSRIAVDIPIFKSPNFDISTSIAKSLMNLPLELTSAISGYRPMEAVKNKKGKVTGVRGGDVSFHTPEILNTAAGITYQPTQLMSGNLDTFGSFLSPLKTNLIMYRPIVKFGLNDTDYNHLYGVPTLKIDKLNTFGGFTKVGGIHIKEMPNATTEEIKEIEELLLEGVILDNTSAIFDISYDYNNTQVSLTNTQERVVFGSTYTTTASVLSGYQIDSISVTMGGIDITSTAVSGNTITIPNISGNIRIRIVSSTIPVYFTISYVGLVGATLSNTSVSILQGSSYYTDITPDYANNYIMSDYVPTVTMSGQTVSVGVTSDRIDIANVQGNIIISGTYPQVSTMINYWERRDTIMTLPEEPIVLTNLNVTFEDGVTQYTGDDIVIDNQTDVAGYFISFTTYNNDSIGIGQTGAIYVNDVYTSQLTAIEFNESQEYYSSYSGLLEWLDKNFTL